MIWTRDDKPWWQEAAKAAAVACATTLATEGIKAGIEWIKERFKTKEQAE